ncbi:Os04g0691466 [Oryza sativa Japonica Group]|jgi:hypothetical protein|uniref:Os04g0691466 protein n=1 Tax=Oryza sativa subsp. japonica TaxID=39947 RepID=A0A0P0WGP8_ORYSJ|nr:hypothetical protein EE612_026443 [Oryza sativa]BAS91784.1 Os04g0691466 [Oryza sativa Japonica Group]
MMDDLSAGEEENQVVVEVRELAVVLELLPDASLVGVGGDVRVEEGADLAEALLLRLPQRRRRRHRRRRSCESRGRGRGGRGGG